MTIKDIKEKGKKAINKWNKIVDEYGTQIVAGIWIFDLILVLIGLGLDIKRIDKRMIFEAGLADKNSDGVWAAIEKIGSELEPDHPGISQKIIEAFNEGFNNCHPGTTWAHDI